MLDHTKSLALQRLELLKSLKLNLDEAKDKLAKESHQCEALGRMRTIQIEIKIERPVGRPGSAKRWPVHILLLICELLVNGTHLSAVPVNIQRMCAVFTSVKAKELPTVNFVRECRVMLQNVNESLSAFQLDNANRWHQVFANGTTRQQLVF